MRPELIRASQLLKKGSPKAVEEALGLLQNTVYSFSMKVCGHPEDAEDTMQEVLYRSLPHLAKIEEPRALAVWLYTVTRNRCWRMRKKPANSRDRTLSLDELMPTGDELAHLLADATRTPEKNVLRAEAHNELHRAVLEIPVPLRLVLVLHDMEELSTEQVAQVLGLQPGTVRVRLHRARLAVRQQLQRMRQSTPRGRRPHTPRPSRPTSCRDLFANLSEYLDDRVEPKTCDEMRTHIESCPSCVAFLRDLQTAIDRCRSLQAECPPEVATHLRALLTREYLRLIGPPSLNKTAAVV
jgi:RNA polymerase sigma-70 factor, ECF subfamily